MKQTLTEFYNRENPDGHYVVWRSRNFYTDDFKPIYGFSGSVVEYTNRDGFKNYPEWMNETDENLIGIMLIEELPDLIDL